MLGKGRDTKKFENPWVNLLIKWHLRKKYLKN